MRALRPMCNGGRCRNESGRHDDLELREFCEDCAVAIRHQVDADERAERDACDAGRGRVVDRLYTWVSGENCALTFACGACGETFLSTQEHRRVDTHTVVNGQRIGRTYFFHMTHVPAWARVAS